MGNGISKYVSTHRYNIIISVIIIISFYGPRQECFRCSLVLSMTIIWCGRALEIVFEWRCSRSAVTICENNQWNCEYSFAPFLETQYKNFVAKITDANVHNRRCYHNDGGHYVQINNNKKIRRNVFMIILHIILELYDEKKKTPKICRPCGLNIILFTFYFIILPFDTDVIRIMPRQRLSAF